MSGHCFQHGEFRLSRCPDCATDGEWSALVRDRDRFRSERDALAAQVAEQEKIIAWWSENHSRQVERVREALGLLGVDDPVNYTGEVRNFVADALVAQVAALAEELANVTESGVEWVLTHERLAELRERVGRLLADIPAAGCALLAERDELRERLAKAEERSRGHMEHRIDNMWAAGDWRMRAERAEASLSQIETMRCQVHPVAGYVFESDPRRIVRAYFAAAAPEEEK